MACPKVDWIVGSAIIIYYATAITELVSSVPVGLVLSDFGGQCVLSAKVEYYDEPIYDNGIQITKFGSTPACEFCAYLTIITIIFPLVYGSYSLYAIYRSLDNASQMWVLPAMMVNVLLMVLKFVSACVLSVGASQLCSAVTNLKQIESCQAGQNFKWFEIVTTPKYVQVVYNGEHYYSYLATAQSAAWFCVFEWFLLSGLTFLHYRRNISLRSRTDQSAATTQSAYGSSSQSLPGNSITNPNFKL